MKWIGAAALGWIVLGCGGAPPAQQGIGGPLVVRPATPAAAAPAPKPVERPADVAAWIHLDDPEALLDLLGATSAFASAPGGALGGVQTWLDLVDTRQPIDVVVLANGERLKDGDVAARVAFKDTKAAIEKLGTEMTVKQEGRRLHVKDKHDAEEDAFACELGSARGPDVAICGTPRGLERAGEWLDGAPLPRPEETARAGKAQPLARAVLFVPPLERVLAKEPPKTDGDKATLALFHDMQSVSVELGRDGTGLAFAITARFDSKESELARELLQPTNALAPNEAFYRVWQDTSAAIFVTGGGALPKWAKDVAAKDDVEPATAAKRAAAVAKMAKALERPVVGGYGIRTDRARAALAAVRTAKDQEKATQALEKALEAYVVDEFEIDVATTEAAMRDLAAVWNAEEARATLTATPAPAPGTKGAPGRPAHAAPKWSVRAAGAALALPKGSFFLDEHKRDWSYTTAMKPTPTPPKTVTESTLFFAEGSSTWSVTGQDDASCAATAKRLLAAKNPKVEEDALFKRKGVVAAGYLSSLVGAFAMHRLALGLSGISGSAGAGTSTSALAEIEHDLASPRMPLPFVLTAQGHGDGGLATFEIRGERAAFQMLGEHVGAVIGGGFVLLMVLAMMGGAP